LLFLKIDISGSHAEYIVQHFRSPNAFKAGDMISASPSLTNGKLVLPMIAMESVRLLKKSG